MSDPILADKTRSLLPSHLLTNRATEDVDNAEEKYLGDWKTDFLIHPTAENLHLRRGTEKRDKVLRELPNYFLTARYFESASMEKMLKRAATDSFWTVMCYKGSQPCTEDYAAYTDILTETLETAFSPEFWPRPRPYEAVAPYGDGELAPPDDIADYHAGRILRKVDRDTTRSMWAVSARAMEDNCWEMELEDDVRDRVEQGIHDLAHEAVEGAWDGLLDEVVLAVDGSEAAADKERAQAIYVEKRCAPCVVPCKVPYTPSTKQGGSSPASGTTGAPVAQSTGVGEARHDIFRQVAGDIDSPTPLKRKALKMTTEELDVGDEASPTSKKTRVRQGTNGDEICKGDETCGLLNHGVSTETVSPTRSTESSTVGDSPIMTAESMTAESSFTTDTSCDDTQHATAVDGPTLPVDSVNSPFESMVEPPTSTQQFILDNTDIPSTEDGASPLSHRDSPLPSVDHPLASVLGLDQSHHDPLPDCATELPPPWQSTPLHPALDPLREAYVEQLYTHRFDLLQNPRVLMTLSETPHLSAAFLRHGAARGGMGAEWLLPAGGRRAGVVRVTPAAAGVELLPGDFADRRHACLNCPEWMCWVAENRFLMAAFWAEVAGRGGWGYLRERKEVRGQASIAPF